MIIGVDGNEANVDKHVGTSVYALELLRHWQALSSSEKSFIIYLRDKPRSSLPKETAHFRYRIVAGTRFWRDVFFPLHLYMHREIDVLFCPAHYAPRFCPVPFVVAIHDLAYEFFPDEFLKKDLYKLTSWTTHAVTRANHVICVSESTKKDLVQRYTLNQDHISVVYNGFRSLGTQPPHIQKQTLKTFSLSHKKYILYVGTLQPRKNIKLLLQSFARLLHTHPHLKLVIVGKKGWLYEDIFTHVQHLDLQEHVVFTDYVSNEVLSCLYSQAAVYVLPSLYEGFGIPLLEAMDHSCPVASSSASALPEIGGDACEYFDPRDEYSCATAIQTIVDSPDLQKQLVDRGKKRVTLFSFKHTSEQTLEAIEHACA